MQNEADISALFPSLMGSSRESSSGAALPLNFTDILAVIAAAIIVQRVLRFIRVRLENRAAVAARQKQQ